MNSNLDQFAWQSHKGVNEYHKLAFYLPFCILRPSHRQLDRCLEESARSIEDVCHARFGGTAALADCTQLCPNLRIPREHDRPPLTDIERGPLHSSWKSLNHALLRPENAVITSNGRDLP